MQIKKVFVCPHGDSILQPQKIEAYAKDNQELHDSMVKIAQEIKEIKPDLIFYITPHNIALSENHCIFLNNEGFGRVEPPSGEIQEINLFKANIDIDRELSIKMVEYLKKNNKKVEGCTSFSESQYATLAWAEVVPLHFVQKEYTNFKTILFSISERRQYVANKMVDEMQSIGNDIYDFIQNNVDKDQKVVVINSCDLAHTFKIEYGPDVGQEPYGVSDTAQPFDDFIHIWAQHPTKEQGLQSLYKDAAEIVMEALSCGFCGLVLISGIFNSFVNKKIKNTQCDICTSDIQESQESQQKNDQSQITYNVVLPTVYCILHPTYFGMMTASFTLFQGEYLDNQKQLQQKQQ